MYNRIIIDIKYSKSNIEPQCHIMRVITIIIGLDKLYQQKLIQNLSFAVVLQTERDLSMSYNFAHEKKKELTRSETTQAIQIDVAEVGQPNTCV